MLKFKYNYVILSDSHWWIFVVILMAFAVRISVMLWLGRTGVYGGDEAEYVALAKQLLRTGRYCNPPVDKWANPIQGGRPGDPTAFRTPGFPLFLACHYWLFGEHDIFPKITLVLLSSLTCMLVAALGREVFSRSCGLFAGMIWAFWPPAILSGYRADSFYTETLATFLVVASITSFSFLIRKNSSYLPGIAGLLLGLAILSRPYFILSIPFFFLWMFLLPCLRGSRLRVIAVFFVGLTLTIGIWLVRNQVVFGKPLLSTQSEHLYMGNNLWARGSMLGDVWTLGVKAPQWEVLRATYPNIWETGELERSEIWKKEGIKSVLYNLSRPRRFIWLELRKALLFWGPFQDWSFGYYRYHYAFAFVLPFVPIGLLSSYRRGLGAGIILLLIPIFAVFVVCMMAYSHDRFRYPIEPFLVLIGSSGMIEVFQLLRR